MDDLREWEALLERLRTHRVPYRLTEVPLARELQLFVEVEPGIVVEFVTISPARRA
jgi:hypothetical protein